MELVGVGKGEERRGRFHRGFLLVDRGFLLVNRVGLGVAVLVNLF